MLFTTPEQFIVLGILLVGGWLLGYASAPAARKWKRRVREQSDSFTAHYRALEETLRESEQRVVALQDENAALRADRVAAERTIAGLRAAAASVPAPPPVAPVEPPRTALALVETVPEPAAEPKASASAEPEPYTVPIVDEPLSVVEEPEAEAQDSAEEASEMAPKGAPATARDTFPEPTHAAASSADAAPPAAPADASAEAGVSLPVDAVIEAPAPMTPAPLPVAAPAPIGPAEPEMPRAGWFASSARDDLTRIRGIDGVLDTRLFGLGVTRYQDIEKLSDEDEMALEQRLNLPVGYVGREQWRTQAALLRAGKTEEHAAHFGEVDA